MATPKIIADFETQLASTVSIGSTSFTLASATDDDGVALPSGKYFFTINNASTQKEYVVGTLSGTSVTDVSNVSRQGVQTSGTARAHRIGSSVIMTDFLTYKDYIDETTTAGAPDASTTTKGVVEIATLAEVRAGTGVGATGAILVVSPTELGDLPSQDQKAALAGGSTFGTPSGTNKYATEDFITSKHINGYASGVTTSATSTIAHGLGYAPSHIRIQAMATMGTGNVKGAAHSAGTYDGTNTRTIWVSHLSSDSSSSAESQLSNGGTETTYVVYLYNEANSGYRRATVTVDATNINLTWSTTGTNIGDAQVLWEAFA